MTGARWPLRGLGHLAAALTWGFPRALRAPERAQRAVAARIARDHARTALGRHDRVRGPDDAARIPPRTWDELAPWLERQRAGEPAVVTPHRIRLVEPTSGSEGARKLVPYTAPLLGAFSRMFLVWIADLLRHGPPLASGRFYLSVSPRFAAAEATPDGLPVGLDDDVGYLDGWMRPLVSRFLVQPPGARSAADPEAFRRAVARGLLSTPDLEAISVWNPSFLAVLLDWIAAHRDELTDALDADRRDALTAAPPNWARIWPALRLVSCWADGHAAVAAERLAARLPQAILQPKGLLATEAPVTVPLVGAPAGVPLVDRVWIELLDEHGALRPLTGGEDGEVYELVVSAVGGLPRYRLGDRVRLRGRHLATPCLELVGRTGGVVDLVGEKLHPDHVARALAEAAPIAAFRTLVPARRPRDHYVLLTDAPADPGLAARVDDALAAAHHYRLARQLGQLGPVELLTRPDAAAAWQAAAAGAARLGDVKDRPLWPRPADDLLDRLRGLP